MSHAQTRRDFLKTAATVSAAGWTVAAQTPAVAAPAPGTRPNIVFILIDDLRFDTLGVLGHPFVQTPHLDALARNGVICENSFVTTSLCSPSRASILTGLYAHRHEVLDNGTPLPADAPLFSIELQKAGYDTAFIGKWHMGGGSDAPQPGFNRWVSFKGQGVYLNPTFNVDGKTEKQEGYITDLLTDRAVDFIKAPREKPFLLYLSHKAVHAEFKAAERHQGCYADQKYPYPASMANTEENYRGKPDWVRRQRNSWHGVDGMYNKSTDFDTFARDYCETVRAVDDSVGRVAETLKAQGVLDNTLILFTSDNGFQFGEHGLIDKRTMYEASIRIPMIAHGPALFPGGRRLKEMVLNVDIAPTLLDAAGVTVPESMQGRSMMPKLRGEDSPWREEFLYEYFWERSFPQTPTVLGVRTDRYKLMQYHGIWDRYELYDLENDPDEMNNLLAPYLLENEGGTLDELIRRQADEPVKRLFIDMKRRLDRLLRETGARPEPTWTELR
jgi:N-acetylglucosamine-6-sulfatase